MSRTYYPEGRVLLKAWFDGTPRDRPIAFPVMPRRLQVKRNSYEKADSWSLDFDFIDAPILPRDLQTAAVEIYLYDRRALDADLTVVAAGPYSRRPALSGLADDVEAEFDDRGGESRISGQDFTALFVDWPWRHDRKGRPDRIPVGKRLDRQLEALIREVDPRGVVRLITQLGGSTPAEEERLRAQLPVVGTKTTRAIRNGFSASAGASYWSVMYEMANFYAYTLFARDDTVVLAAGETLWSDTNRPIYHLRFGGRDANLKRIRFSRKLGKERTPVIEVRSYDEEARKTIVVRYPKRGEEAATGIGTKREEVQRFNAWGVTDMTILRRLARSMYEQIGQSEQIAEFETFDLRDVRDQDLLALKTGDAVFVEFDPLERELGGLNEPQRRRALLERGYPAEVAAELAKAERRHGVLAFPLRLKDADLDWDHDRGLKIAGRLQAFVTPGGARG